jgi:hypothetical protein
MASVVTTDGNLHLDAAASANATYINYYAGTQGVAFGNGSSGIVAWMGPDGDLWKGGGDNSGTQYVQNSGTWGINVTGSAGSTTVLNQIASFPTANNQDFNSLTTGGYYNIVWGNFTGTLNTPSGSANSYGTLLVQNGLNFTSQLYMPHATSSSPATRVFYNGSWTAWAYTLSSANYTSYAPSLAGSGASGTWGINVTGTSGSISGFNNPTTAATANTIAYRNGDGDIAAREIILSSGLSSSQPTVLVSMFPTTNQLVRTAPSAVANAIRDAASGTWGISITGNAATATSATDSTKLPLTGGTISGVLSFPQNPVGTTYGNGQSAVPSYYIGQAAGDNDAWKLYGESASTNTVRMVFEVNDDIETAGHEWVFRNKKTYGDYAATEPFRISGAGEAYVSGNVVLNASNYTSYAPSLTGSGASGTWGISIGGNAATATTATTANALATGNNYQVNSLGVGTAASGTAGEIRATNNITAYYSDDRLKTRLGTIDDALGKLMSLSGFYYEANDVAQALGYEVKKEVGVSAQEVQAVMPEVVAPAPIDEQYLTVRYERLVPLLIEAIKEQQVQINELKSRLKD